MNSADSLFDPIENLSKSELRNYQLHKLQNTLLHSQENSPLYQKKLVGYSFDEFTSLDAIAELPFTTKDDLLAGSPHDILAVPLSDVIEVHFSSGTTKKPVPSFLTKKDIEAGNKALARTWYMQGVRPSSVFGMFASYGLFSAGLLNHYALQHIGAFVVPISNASSEKAIHLLKEFGITSMAAVASYYFHLLHKIESLGLSPQDFSLQTLVAGGEPFTETERSFIQEKYGARMFDQYGLCEINTGLAGECECQDGLHILADYAYPEIINPVTGEPCAEGEVGELVLTSLQKEATPLIRYKTGDLTSITYEPCECGRTMPRIARIKERVSKTIFYKGLKIERPYVRDMMANLHAFIDPFIWNFTFTTNDNKQSVAVKVKPQSSIDADQALRSVQTAIKQALGIQAQVLVFSPTELHSLEGHKVSHFTV